MEQHTCNSTNRCWYSTTINFISWMFIFRLLFLHCLRFWNTIAVHSVQIGHVCILYLFHSKLIYQSNISDIISSRTSFHVNFMSATAFFFLSQDPPFNSSLSFSMEARVPDNLVFSTWRNPFDNNGLVLNSQQESAGQQILTRPRCKWVKTPFPWKPRFISTTTARPTIWYTDTDDATSKRLAVATIIKRGFSRRVLCFRLLKPHKSSQSYARGNKDEHYHNSIK